MRTLLFSFLVLSFGCRRPPDAPNELNKLTGYLFMHGADEDHAELEAGFGNLHQWMKKRLSETIDGYTVNNLSQDEVNTLDACERDISGLIGAAVGTVSDYDVEHFVSTIVAGPTMDIYDTYLKYRREPFMNDGDCFASMECTQYYYDAYATKKFPLGIEARSNSRVQHQWVETERGTAHVYRSWLMVPVRATPDWVDVQQQFYLSAMMPWDNGQSIRLQAIWAVTEFGDAPVPENMALQIAIDEMQADAETLEAWLDGR
jgi:hypothetical protein